MNREGRVENEEDEEQTFEELGLDPRLIRALTKKTIDKPTPIQRVAIPLILVSLQYFHSLRSFVCWADFIGYGYFFFF